MRDRTIRSPRVLLPAAALACALLPAPAHADIVSTPVLLDGPSDTACVAAAPFSGWTALADTFQDRVEIRDARGTIHRTISRAELAALAPWMSLDGGPDGPSALAFSASGRLLYILLHDDTTPADGQPSDALLRYDLSADTLVRQARLELFNRGDIWPHLAAVHHAGYLYAATAFGQIVIYPAFASAISANPIATWTLPGAPAIHGLALDRDNAFLYVATDSAILRAPLPASPATTPTFTQIAAGSDIRALAWGDHYGAPAQRGLYILTGTPAGSAIDFIAAAVAQSFTGITPSHYTTSTSLWHSLAATADGKLLVGADDNAVLLSDTSDTRLSFDAWTRDELAQAAHFGRGLISADGEPSGWVIDGDVLPNQSRFHPATPDAAAWTVLLLLMNERINSDALAHQDIARVLTRYAGLAADNIRPVRNADGIFKHWLDPLTGNTKATWPDEYATLSTMKIVAAAARAMDHYPDDPAIARAASRIIFLTRNWDAYLQPGSDALAFKALSAGGPDTTSWAAPYHEGIIFAEQAGAYGALSAQIIASQWFNRSNWPTATWIPGRPITVASTNQFQPAFLSLYPAILSSRFRADASPTGWHAQIDNLRWSSAAFTDDTPTRYYTVFSAGTSPSGYNADTLTNHPGNLTTFTSLLALTAFGDPAEAVAGYAAYRKGARQTFKSGASILYRRPYDSGTFVPNSAGLPDVALGALGLSEIIDPGAIDALLARTYPTIEMCPQDLTADGRITIDDLYAATLTPTDLNGDAQITPADPACLENYLRRTELRRMSAPQRP